MNRWESGPQSSPSHFEEDNMDEIVEPAALQELQMKLSLEKWLLGQSHREDAVGELTRKWVPKVKTQTDTREWLADIGDYSNWRSTVEQIESEYAAAVECLSRSESAPTFPKLFASEDYERKLQQSCDKHKAQPELSSDAYLRRKHFGLQKAIEGRTLIYLDTNHWINLRHILLDCRHARKEYAEILLLLDQLAAKRRVLCPISFPLFLELMKQSDMETRKATAELMQHLSGGVCIQIPDWLEKVELRQRTMKVLLGSEAPDLNEWIWTKVGYVAGEILPHNEVWPEGDGNFIRKLSIDAMWELPLEYFIENDSEQLPHDAEHLLAEATNQDAAWYRGAKLPYPEVLAREKAYRVRRLLYELKQLLHDLWNEYPNHRDVSNMTPPNDGDVDPWALPSSQVLAGINAALIHSGKRFSANDILDFQHAALAVPYFDALFCDRRMANTLISKPLEFGSTYDTKIYGRADEISAYLRNLL